MRCVHACLRAQPAAVTRLGSQDVDINRRLGEHGARLVPAGSNVLHHCNTGALATVDIGTALGVIYSALLPR